MMCFYEVFSILLEVLILQGARKRQFPVRGALGTTLNAGGTEAEAGALAGRTRLQSGFQDQGEEPGSWGGLPLGCALAAGLGVLPGRTSAGLQVHRGTGRRG